MNNIKTISIQDENYPSLLKKISHPPSKIYYRGNISINSPTVAIVGTRNFSIYGKQAVLDIARELSSWSFIIVSGLARGIDTFAHQATLWEEGKTIAVLGTGIDDKSIYPHQNVNLAKKIIESGGSIISEFPPGTRATKFNFPKRNRIISGLSLGVIVIEARKKSGALITAEWGKKQGRKIMAVPGSIYNLNSQGTNNLISNGATLIRNAQDVIKALGAQKINKIKQKVVKGENREEQLIINSLQENALHIEMIIQKTKLPAPTVISCLSNLETKNKVINLGGNVYTINR